MSYIFMGHFLKDPSPKDINLQCLLGMNLYLLKMNT